MGPEGFVRYDSFVGSVPQSYIDKKSVHCPLCGSGEPCWAIKQKEGANPPRIMFRCQACEGVLSVDEKSVFNGDTDAIALVEDDGKSARVLEDVVEEADEYSNQAKGPTDFDKTDVIFSSSGNSVGGGVCPKCGSVLETGGRFCSNCGTNINLYQPAVYPHAVHHFQQEVSAGAVQPWEQKRPETNAAYCSKCGKPLGTVGGICNNCGAKSASFVIPTGHKAPPTPVLKNAASEKIKFPVAPFILFLLSELGFFACEITRIPTMIFLANAGLWSSVIVNAVFFVINTVGLLVLLVGFLLYKKKATYLFGAGFAIKSLVYVAYIVYVLVEFINHGWQIHASEVISVVGYFGTLISMLLIAVGFFVAKTKASIILKVLGALGALMINNTSYIIARAVTHFSVEQIIEFIIKSSLTMVIVPILLYVSAIIYNPHKKKQ